MQQITIISLAVFTLLYITLFFLIPMPHENGELPLIYVCIRV